jgi:arylsulfatase A-like enzyme
MTRREIIKALLAAPAMASLPSFGADAPGKRPNIVFIMIDTLRADHVGCYGYKLPTTPNLDKLASQGVRIEQMISASCWTMPSVGTMFTSLHPSQHHITNTKSHFPKGITTLADEFRKAGYHTAGVTTNPLVHSKFGYSEGFELYDDFTVMLTADLDLFGDAVGGPGAETPPNIQLGRGGVSSPMVNRFAESFLAKQKKADKPFFLFLLYFEPHADYVPPAPYNTMFGNFGVPPSIGVDIYPRGPKHPYTPAEKKQIVSLYDGEIRYADEHIGKVLADLEKLGLDNDTIVLALADHGEEFWEHDGFLHGDTLYEEQVHVPCIIRYPGRFPAGTVLRHQASQLDVMPTLLNLAGIPIPDQCLGRSLAPVLHNPKAPFQPRIAFLEAETNAHTDLRAARLPSRKLIHDLLAESHQAFDLAKDPLEHHAILAPPFPLRKPLDVWSEHMRIAQEQKKADNPAPVQLDQKHLNILKTLGYLR